MDRQTAFLFYLVKKEDKDQNAEGLMVLQQEGNED